MYHTIHTIIIISKQRRKRDASRQRCLQITEPYIGTVEVKFLLMYLCIRDSS